MKGLKNTLGALVVCITIVSSANAYMRVGGVAPHVRMAQRFHEAGLKAKVTHPRNAIGAYPFTAVATGIAVGAAINEAAKAYDVAGKLWNAVPEKVKAFFAAIPAKATELSARAWNAVPTQTADVIASEVTGAAALILLIGVAHKFRVQLANRRGNNRVMYRHVINELADARDAGATRDAVL